MYILYLHQIKINSDFFLRDFTLNTYVHNINHSSFDKNKVALKCYSILISFSARGVTEKLYLPFIFQKEKKCAQKRKES